MNYCTLLLVNTNYCQAKFFWNWDRNGCVPLRRFKKDKFKSGEIQVLNLKIHRNLQITV